LPGRPMQPGQRLPEREALGKPIAEAQTSSVFAPRECTDVYGL